MYTKLSILLRSSFLLLLTTIFLTACESSDVADSSTGVQTGEVTLLITDAPTSAYDEVNVVAESVTLIGEGQDAPLAKPSPRVSKLPVSFQDREWLVAP